MIDSMDSWKSEAACIKSRCGFCGQTFAKWQERVDHLAKHFKAGAKMSDWKGCRGLEPAVAAQVTNAMPPYLIANEAKSPWPFSASNKASMMQVPHSQLVAGSDLESAIHAGVKWPLEADQSFLPWTSARPIEKHDDCLDVFLANLESNGFVQKNSPPPPDAEDIVHFGMPAMSTCWEILTLRLGRFVREQLQAGIVPTDEAIQRHARMMEFGEDDAWNQTAADDPTWMELFKKAHGLSGAKPTKEERNFLMEDLGANLGELDIDIDQFVVGGGWDGMEKNNAGATSIPFTTAASVPVTGMDLFATAQPTTMADVDLFGTSMPPATTMSTADVDFANSLPATLSMDSLSTSMPVTTLDELLAVTVPTSFGG
jgi:hypothetical protein